MSNRRTESFRQITAATVMTILAMAGAPAYSQEMLPHKMADTSRWACGLCPYRYGWEGNLQFGVGWVSDDSLKFGDYRGLEDEGAFLALDGDVHWRAAGGRFLDVYGENVGLDSRKISMRGGQRGRYRLTLGYQEIPKYRGFGAETPFVGVGSGELNLPADWQSAPTTSGFTSLAGSLGPTELSITRKTTDAGLRWKIHPQWTWEINIEHQKKEGTRPFGGGVFTLVTSQFPAPVDFSTGRLDMALSYAGARGNLRFGFDASEFDNHIQSLTWQNPFDSFDGTEVLRASLEPDNSFYQASLSGAMTLSPSIRISGEAAWGHMSQDDPLLPWSINPEFSELPLPRLTADTDIDVGTLILAGKLTARLARNLDLTASLKRDDRDNDTPVDIWVPVVTDFIQRGERPNRPYSFERDRASLQLRYRPNASVRVQAGMEVEDIERSLQSVMETDETTVFAEASLSPGSQIEIRARLQSSDRDAGPFREVDTLGLAEHPLMRKFHLADRDRDRMKVDVDWYPLPRLTLSLTWSDSEDDYEESVLGLKSSEVRNAGLDVSWAAGDDWSLFAWISRDEMDSSLSGAEDIAAVPWNTHTEDEFLTAGLGANVQVSGRLSLRVDFVSSESEGDILTTDVEGGGYFPTLRTDLRNLRLQVEYRTGPRWAWNFYVEHEKYDSSDWAIDGFGPDSIPDVLTFGAESPDYSVTVLRLQGVYRF